VEAPKVLTTKDASFPHKKLSSYVNYLVEEENATSGGIYQEYYITDYLENRIE
jgi:hypothetical protein